MNFEDEPYVRLYIRRTLTNKRLRWEGRAVLHEMLYVFDRAGLFEFEGDLADAVETMTELPQKVVVVGLKRLLDAKTWVVRAGVLFWPKYLEAQTATRSDPARQRESRARRAAVEHARSLLGADAPEQHVTERDEVSRHVTDPAEPVQNGHDPSRSVTPSLAVHSLAEPDDVDARGGDSGPLRETVCPFDLPDRAAKLRIPEQFAKAYGVSVDVVGWHIEETRNYWIAGGGAGKRRSNWMRTLRTRLHELGKAGGLTVPRDGAGRRGRGPVQMAPAGHDPFAAAEAVGRREAAEREAAARKDGTDATGR